MNLCLNAPAGLNPLDLQTLKHLPSTAKTGIVVGAGDGRILQAIKEKLGKNPQVVAIEPNVWLHKYLKGVEGIGENPWNYDFYAEKAKQWGGIDFIIFNNIHEYWNGRIRTLEKILQLVKPDGCAFISFYNRSTLYEINRQLPPFNSGFERLANPMDTWARMDLASWMIFCSDVGMHVDAAWGLLQPDAFKYCQAEKRGTVKWSTNGLNIEVKDLGDAFVYGAPVISLKLSPNLANVEKFKTNFQGIAFTPHIFQAILFPYEDFHSDELRNFSAGVETYFYEQGHEPDKSLLEFFTKQLTEFSDVKNVLVVGCGWGADMIPLKSLKPNWKFTGLSNYPEQMRRGEALMKKHGITIKEFSPESKLPFKDGEFDLVVSLLYCSNIHQPLAEKLVPEFLRVAKQGVAHFEDVRGPELSMQLKAYNLIEVYENLKYHPTLVPIQVNEELTGMYILKIKKN